MKPSKPTFATGMSAGSGLRPKQALVMSATLLISTRCPTDLAGANGERTAAGRLDDTKHQLDRGAHQEVLRCRIGAAAIRAAAGTADGPRLAPLIFSEMMLAGEIPAAISRVYKKCILEGRSTTPIPEEVVHDAKRGRLPTQVWRGKASPTTVAWLAKHYPATLV
jgi:hypothetical protein